METRVCIPTPEEFAEQMKDASIPRLRFGKFYEDCEDTHSRMDGLMCDLLRELGYGEAVDIFEDSPKWYA